MPPHELFSRELFQLVRLPAVPRSESALRRRLDFGAALLLLLGCAPVMLWAALAVKISSPGPVFYRQKRVGRDGRIFEIWKFRTMTAAQNDRMAGQCGPCVTAQDDLRITPLGRHLRSWKVDELPQLFNVLRGDMSLVGPRPQVPQFVDCFEPRLRRVVLSVRPGMTGPTALYFRHEEFLLTGQPDRERFYIRQILPIKLRMDAEYVHTRSLRNDLHVLADTLHLVLSRLTGQAGHSGIPAACDLAEIQTALQEQAESSRIAVSQTA